MGAQAPPSFANFSISSRLKPTATASAIAPAAPSPKSVAPPPDYLPPAPSASRRAKQRERERDEGLSGIVRLNGHNQGQHWDEETELGFEMLVVGCGGGPLETNLSSYLIKPYSKKWSDGCTSLEAGSGIGAISNLIEASPHSFRGFDLQIGVDDDEEDEYVDPVTGQKREFVGPGREGGGRAAGKIWSYIRCFAVTHAHLDHIQGLVISSGAALYPRPLYGVERTINNIDNLLDGGVWPKLAGWEGDGVLAGRAYLYRDIPVPTTEPLSLSEHLSFHGFPLSHGLDPSAFHPKHKHRPPGSPIECYDSTAFFVKEDVTGEEKEFLFFGDVEPDSISKRPLNFEVWKAAAPRIAARKLSAIFLECSYPTSQPPEKLWGHLSPPYMFEELKTLARLVVDAKIASGVGLAEARLLPLAGVHVVIIHIKDDILPLPIPPTSVTPASPSPDLPLTASPAVDSAEPSPSASPSFGMTPSPVSTASSRFECSTSLPTLSMSPPVPSPPVRRASGGNLAGGGWGFTRRASAAISPPWSPGRRASLPGFLGANVAGLDKLISTFGSPGRRTNGVHKMEGFSGLEPTEELSEGSTNASPVIPSYPASPEVPPPPPPPASKSILRSQTLPSPSRINAVTMPGEEEETEEETVHERIERELNELEEVERTGVRFLRAEQGMRIAF
ncbi:hypothetical protein T439DRAFT_329581 [Meredithblackwellia eburnea MCA 4105]